MTTFSVTRADYSDELTTTTFRLIDTTAANYNTLAGLTTPGQAGFDLTAAVDGVTNGAPRSLTFTPYKLLQGNGAAAVEDAQRERKIQVHFHDNVNFRPGTLEIGCADVSKITVIPSSDLIDLAAGGMGDLVTAIETWHLSIYGNAVTVDNAYLVGRNT